MDYKSLKYYVTVVESGTISAAAKKLYMSQPPLSNQMYKLEEELGCRLFERTTKRIVLTGAGKLLYDRAKLVIQNIDEAEHIGISSNCIVNKCLNQVFVRWQYFICFHSASPQFYNYI